MKRLTSLYKKPRMAENLKFLLIDDDPVFCSIMKAIAIREALNLTICTKAYGIGELNSDMGFDVLLIDYDLGWATGLDLTTNFEKHFGKLPVVLISRSSRNNIEEIRWPESIRQFINKDQGPYAIFNAALDVQI